VSAGEKLSKLVTNSVAIKFMAIDYILNQKLMN
jgi:hypothetical protein